MHRIVNFEKIRIRNRIYLIENTIYKKKVYSADYCETIASYLKDRYFDIKQTSKLKKRVSGKRLGANPFYQ